MLVCVLRTGKEEHEKKSRALLVGAVALCSSMAFANDIDVSTDNTVDFGEKNQSINYHINVKDNANLVINAPDSRPRLTFTSGGGLDITQGTVRINGELNVLLRGTGLRASRSIYLLPVCFQARERY